MMNKHSIRLVGALVCVFVLMNSCKKEKDPTPPGPKEGTYSLGIQAGSVNYILPTKGISEGSVSPVGFGVEVPGNELIQSGNYIYFFSRAEKKFYQFELKADGTVQEKASLLVTSYISDRAYSQNLIDANTILVIDPLVWGAPSVKWFTIKIPDFQISASGSLDLPTFEKAPGVNWNVNVGKAVLHGNKIIMGSVYYDFDGNYAPGTHTIVIDYPSMANPTKLSSDKSTGEIGYTNQLFAKTGNGDLYVGVYRGSYGPPSDDDVFGYILRIKNGQHVFDNDYFFDLSQELGEPTQVMQLNFLEGQSAMAMLFNPNDIPTWDALDNDNYYFAKIDLPTKSVAKFNTPKSSARLGRYPLISDGKYVSFYKSIANNKTNVLEIEYDGGASAFTIGKQILGDGVSGYSVTKHPAE